MATKKANSSLPNDTEHMNSTDEDNDDSPSEEPSQEEEETVEVNGFNVLASQEDKVKKMFKKHRDLVSNFNVENQQIKDAYMDALLDLIETLCQSIKEVSLDDLHKVENTLFDLTRAGFNVNWLRQKLDEAYLKMEKQKAGGARIDELEEQVKKRKKTLRDLESDLKKEKTAVLAAEAGCVFNDLV